MGNLKRDFYFGAHGMIFGFLMGLWRMLNNPVLPPLLAETQYLNNGFLSLSFDLKWL